ncbi:hypothetical protein GUJ93_ZPchr0002g23373 [Zizania palustris]|uniref:Uncharacterized protein n=1 Tax=Zizania palustris TaxID=103762 RepID=A0A8J5S0G9_ZIZPA|nr:hypothetical protein GUJ93_ZPchr0002g23373 [Zizania palustris]
MSHKDVSDDDFSSRNLVDQSFSVVLAGEITDIGPVCLKDLQRILSAIQPSDVLVGPNALEYLALLIHYSFSQLEHLRLLPGSTFYVQKDYGSEHSPSLVMNTFHGCKFQPSKVNTIGFEGSLNRCDIWQSAGDAWKCPI